MAGVQSTVPMDTVAKAHTLPGPHQLFFLKLGGPHCGFYPPKASDTSMEIFKIITLAAAATTAQGSPWCDWKVSSVSHFVTCLPKQPFCVSHFLTVPTTGCHHSKSTSRQVRLKSSCRPRQVVPRAPPDLPSSIKEDRRWQREPCADSSS